MGSDGNICYCKNEDYSSESHITKFENKANINYKNQTKQSAPNRRNIALDSLKKANEEINLRQYGAVNTIIKNYHIYKSTKLKNQNNKKNMNIQINNTKKSNKYYSQDEYFLKNNNKTKNENQINS